MKRPAFAVALLVLGDLIVFYLFALAGLRSHERDLTLGHLLRTAAPFQVGWLIMAALKGLYDPARPGSGGVAKRVLVAWAPAWLIGLAGRGFVFGQSVAPTFAVVAFVTNLVLLVGWRSFASLLLTRPKAGSAPRR